MEEMDLVEEKVPKTRGAVPVVSWSLSQSFHLVLTALAMKSPRGPFPPVFFLRKHFVLF